MRDGRRARRVVAVDRGQLALFVGKRGLDRFGDDDRVFDVRVVVGGRLRSAPPAGRGGRGNRGGFHLHRLGVDRGLDRVFLAAR